MIDKKYKIMAVKKEKNGKAILNVLHTEEDSILFLAKDLAVGPMLFHYHEICKRMGCDDDHLDAIVKLIDRVSDYQRKNGSKVPD